MEMKEDMESVNINVERATVTERSPIKELDIMEELDKLEEKTLSPVKIEKLDIGPNDILVATVDCGKMRGTQVVKHLGITKADLQKTFPDNEVLAISSRVDLSVLHMVENH